MFPRLMAYKIHLFGDVSYYQIVTGEIFYPFHDQFWIRMPPTVDVDTNLQLTAKYYVNTESELRSIHARSPGNLRS